MEDDPDPTNLDGGGWSLSGSYMVRHSPEFIDALHEFTDTACKMLKARAAHEKTLHTLCRKVSIKYLDDLSAAARPPAVALKDAAKSLTELVLAEAGREYVSVEANYLVRHNTMDQIRLGRVRSMPTELLSCDPVVPKSINVRFEVSSSPGQKYRSEEITIFMPNSVWVVEVAATKENVDEEAKWLIDVAVSIMRLGARSWPHRYPKIGDQELHPIVPMLTNRPTIKIENDGLYTGGYRYPGWYEANSDVIEELNSPEIQAKADTLFDPGEGSLAQRVAQGLGWLTRGRQQTDRSERLLSFFTALEAIISTSDKADPVLQTICRHVSVIHTSNIEDRVVVFKQLKRLYGVRSGVVHSGSRAALWGDVNMLQEYAESTFWLVLKYCDLTMSHRRFAQSLSDASHGGRWEFAAQAPEAETPD